MRKLLLGVVVIAAAAFGLVKGFLWYKVKGHADAFVQAAAPFVRISYGGIHTDLRGSVGIDEVVLRPTMTEDEFTLAAVRISAPHLLSLLLLENRLDEGEMPEHLSVSLQRLQIDLDSQLVNLLDEMEPAAVSGNLQSGASLANLDALGCGDREHFAVKDLLAMGIRRVALDWKAELSHEPGSGVTTVDLQMADPGLFRVDLNMQITGKPGAISPEDGLPSGRVTYTDEGWYRKRNDYCALLNKGSVSEYVEQHLAEVATRFGIALPEAMADSYRQFMLEGGTVALALNPQPHTPVTELPHYPPQDLIEVLGLELVVNEQPFDMAAIAWKPKTEAVTSATPAAKAPVAGAPPAPAEPTFRRVDIDALHRHIDNRARIRTHDGKLREGLVQEVADGRVQLTMQLRRGTLTYPVKLRDIASVEVLH